MMTTRFSCLLLLGVALASACSSKEQPPPMIVPDAEAGVMPEAGPMPDAALPSTVSVGTGSDSVTFQVVTGSVFDGEPAEGALVYFDDGARGDRVVASAGADGLVTFSDAILIGAGAMAYLDSDHGIASFGGLNAAAITALSDGGYGNDSGELVLAIPRRRSSRDLVTVSGTAPNRMGDQILVSALVDGTLNYSGRGSTWEIEVPVDTPFGLLGVDISGVMESTVSPRGGEATFHGWAHTMSEGLSADTMDVEIDFVADSIDATAFMAGSFALPTDEFFAGADPVVYLLDARSLSLVGYRDRIDVNEAGTRVEFSGEYVMPEGVSAVLGVYSFSDGPVRSQIIRSGVPASGMTDLDFLAPPDIVTPAFGIVQNVGDEIEWRADASPAALISLRDGEGDLMWRHVLPPGTSTASLPRVPAAVDAGTYFIEAELNAQISLCADFGRLCGRYANARAFGVVVR